MSQQVDAGPWLPQCVQAPEEAAEYFWGRGAREPSDWETAAHQLGSRDLPRVDAAMERFGGAAGSKDPAESSSQPEPEAESTAQEEDDTSLQPKAKLTPAAKQVPPRPRVVEPRPGYGPSTWDQDWWADQWWGSSQDAWRNDWGWQADWSQRWW